MYNGKYETVIDVIISGKNHKQCLEISKIVKKYCDSWVLVDVKYTEHKSAPKGDVLGRSLLVYQTAYSHDIITFREGLNCILCYFIYDKTVKVSVRFTDPVDIKDDLEQRFA